MIRNANEKKYGFFYPEWKTGRSLRTKMYFQFGGVKLEQQNWMLSQAIKTGKSVIQNLESIRRAQSGVRWGIVQSFASA